jgi:hypothetical protein
MPFCIRSLIIKKKPFGPNALSNCILQDITLFVALMYSVFVRARQPIPHTNIAGSLRFRAPVESADKKAKSSALWLVRYIARTKCIRHHALYLKQNTRQISRYPKYCRELRSQYYMVITCFKIIGNCRPFGRVHVCGSAFRI